MIFERTDLNIFISYKETFRSVIHVGTKNTPSCFMTSRTWFQRGRRLTNPSGTQTHCCAGSDKADTVELSSGRSSRGAPPTPGPGASLAGLPPAISLNPRDLAGEAGVLLSSTDWSNLNDGAGLSESLLVFRLQNGRGKAERHGSRRQARSAPARSRGRRAEAFAREPPVVAPPPPGFLSR